MILKGKKITCIFADFLVLFAKWSLLSLPRKVSRTIYSPVCVRPQFPLRKHTLRYWACAWYMHLIPEYIFEHAQKTDAPELATTEVMFSRFVAKHNLPAAIAGHCCSLASYMCPDSTIAKAMKCKRRGRRQWYWHVASLWRGLWVTVPIIGRCKYSITFETSVLAGQT